MAVRGPIGILFRLPVAFETALDPVRRNELNVATPLFCENNAIDPAPDTFPKNIQISTRCAGWRESAIDAWLCNPMFYRVED